MRAPAPDCDLATVAALVGDPGRAAMLLALLDGRALPAGELARIARVAPPTASAHLARLVDGGLLVAERHGRHRYFRLAGAPVARALEALALVAPPRPARAAALPGAVHMARTCYDHLAGWLGVRVGEALVAGGALTLDERGYQPGPDAAPRLAALGVDLAAVAAEARRARRPLTRVCLDWSERRPHLAGALGAAVADALLDRGWLARLPAGRALRVTPTGRRALRDLLGIDATPVLAPRLHDPSPGAEASAD